MSRPIVEAKGTLEDNERQGEIYKVEGDHERVEEREDEDNTDHSEMIR